jgi:hypothetical protein
MSEGGGGDAKHGLLKCSETRKWREECVNSKRLNIVTCTLVYDRC